MEVINRKSKANKIIKIVIILLAFFSLVFLFYMYKNNFLQKPIIDQENSNFTIFESVEVMPNKVKVGEKQTTTVKIKSDEEIEKVFAQIPFEGSYDEISLKLVSGNAFDGIWQCEWIAHNTLTKEYETKIIAITKQGGIEKTSATWWDDTETTWLEGWQERKKITVTETSGSTLADYQTIIDLDGITYDNSGLVGSWHFSEGSGTSVKDFSGNNNEATIHSASWSSDMHGDSNLALSFDGVNNFVDTETSSVFELQEHTFSVWINAVDFNAYRGIMEIKVDSGTIQKTRLMTFGDEIRYHPSYGDANTYVSFTNLPTNKWIHIVGTWDGSTAKGYLNGEKIGEISFSGPITYVSTPSFQIGRDSSLERFFNGSIDEARVYGRALSEDEIKELYGEGKGRLDMNDLRFTSADGVTELSYWLENDNKAWVKIPTLSASSDTNIYCYFGNNGTISSGSSSEDTFINDMGNLLAGWNFNEGSGSSVYDYSGNENTGTITSATFGSGRNNQSGYSLSFDGLDDYVTVADNDSLEPSSDFTIAFWVYPTDWSHDATAISFLSKRSATTDGYFLFYYKTTTSLNFDWGGSGSRWDSGYNTPLNQWDYVVLTRNNSARKLYINGNLYSQTTSVGSSSVTVTTSELLIGKNSLTDGYYFKGLMDDVQIYDRVLSDSEISNSSENSLYMSGDYEGNVLIHKYSSSEPTCSVSSQEEIKPTRSGTTGVSGGGPMMF